MKTLLTTTMTFGLILMLGVTQSTTVIACAACEAAGHYAPAYGYNYSSYNYGNAPTHPYNYAP
ncbi:MAG: hypothetical protein HYX35_00875 [Proteobacteria bacterium]|nr:hypothetical protein [Pseudomonadota bacterium]